MTREIVIMPKKAKELPAVAVAKFKHEGRYAAGGVDGLHLRITGHREFHIHHTYP